MELRFFKEEVQTEGQGIGSRIGVTANRIMEITPNGLIDKECTYDEYLENDEAARKRQIVEIEEDDE